MPYWRRLLFLFAATCSNDQRALARGQILLGFATMVPIQTAVSAQTGLGEPLAGFFL
jgi:hypothetical protein